MCGMVHRVAELLQRKSIFMMIGGVGELVLAMSGINGHTVIEKDHLGDWSPEKDCC